MNTSDANTMRLGTLGEKAFLAHALPRLIPDPRLLGGFGHDAAVVELQSAPFNLIHKIDRASYPVAIKRGWSGYEVWGRMAITANCSDILASGGEPISCMLAIIMPNDALVEDVEAIMQGASDECWSNDVIYAGGDIKEGTEAHVVGTAAGIIDKDGFLPRDGAAPGDRIFCAGLIGGFAGAYFLLQDKDSIGHDHRNAFIEYLQSPRAQWRVARVMNSKKLAHSGMDASDGLLDVLQTFASAGVRINIWLDRIPYHPFAVECAERTNIRQTQLIFGGGDWNILYCIPKEASDQLLTLQASDFPFYCIGEVTKGRGVYAIDAEGREFRIEGVINEHFRSRIEDADSFMSHIKKDNFLKMNG